MGADERVRFEVRDAPFQCQTCSEFSGSIDDLKDHVSSAHSIWWGEYITIHPTCRTCSNIIPTDDIYYCSDECLQADPDPPNVCPACEATLEKGIDATDPDQHDCPASNEQGEGQSTDSESKLSLQGVDTENIDLSIEAGGADTNPPPTEIDNVETPPEHPLLSDEDVDVDITVGGPHDVSDRIVCDMCHGFSTNRFSQLAEHLDEKHGKSFQDYVDIRPLHHCANCETHLSSLDDLLCSECEGKDGVYESSDVKIPCQYCGKKWVGLDDPFCSSGCAANRLEYGSPYNSPEDVDEKWLDHPYRLENGIPYAAPTIAQNNHICRHCYLYGSDDLKGIAQHVGKGHDISWADYIEMYRLQECRTCGDSLRSLTTRYCDSECQYNDPNPVSRCHGCNSPVDIGRIYCSSGCAYKHEVLIK